MRQLVILALSLILAACVTGPKAEQKSPLNVLNGENYKTTADGGVDRVVALPILQRNERNTKISGQVYIADSFAKIPLRMQVLHLKSKGKVIHSVTSDEKGEYLFSAPITNGEYEIELVSENYKGRTSAAISTYENPGYDIEATPK